MDLLIFFWKEIAGGGGEDWEKLAGQDKSGGAIGRLSLCLHIQFHGAIGDDVAPKRHYRANVDGSCFTGGRAHLSHEEFVAVTASDDDFEPKLGRMSAHGARRGERYLRQVLRAASVASGRALTTLGRKIRFDGSRIGRGAGVGRVLSDRHAAFRARRVVIKTRLVKLTARGVKAARLHLRYLQRDGVTREGTPGEIYDARNDRADPKGFIKRSESDRHQFRFIVAVEDATEYEELRSFTRRLMATVEEDLGTKLDWVAVDHFNTGHPHTHVILRGKDDDGRDLIIAREYIAHGMRQRASEIVTLDLGPRTDLEIERKLTQEVEQDRLTIIDRRLLRDAGDQRTLLVGSPADAADRFQQTLRAGRLRQLGRLGLAKEVAPGTWQLSADMEPTLHRMGERSDIIKALHRAMKQAKLERATTDYAIHDARGTNSPIVGRLVERGINEGNERQYLVVDGIDGQSHWVDIGSGDAVEHVPRGTVISVRPHRADPKPADRTIADIARRHEGRYSAEIHQNDDRAASPEFVGAHVRRLEALRRVAGIVEREADGSWRVPDTFLEAAETYEARCPRDAPVLVEVLSTALLEKQVTADGATWLDRQLVGDEAASASGLGFGREVKGALAQRRQWLIEQGLAEERQDQIVYRSNLLALLLRRELSRVAAQVSGELNLPYAEFSGEKRIEGKYVRRLDLASGRFAVIERARDFVLVPWRPILDRTLGQTVSGIVRAAAISWTIGRKRSGPTIS